MTALRPLTPREARELARGRLGKYDDAPACAARELLWQAHRLLTEAGEHGMAATIAAAALRAGGDDSDVRAVADALDGHGEVPAWVTDAEWNEKVQL